MTSVGNNASTASVSTRKGRNPLNRISSLFATKTGPVAEHYVELKEPHRQYGPGDAVSGKVVLGVSRPFGITHLVISLHGYVQVFKNHNRPKAAPQPTNPPLADGRGKRWVTEYYGDGYASLFEEEIVLCGQGRLDPNTYHFEFNLQFPKRLALPSSIEFERGSISYVVTSVITRPASLTAPLSTDRRVLYRERIDVNGLPSPRPRVVTLEPVDRSGKTRSNLKRLTSYPNDRKRQSPVSLNSREGRSTRTLNSTSTLQYEETGSEARTSQSDAASTVSASSRRPSGSRQPTSEPRSSIVSSTPHIQIDVPTSRTITASVKLDRLGCLPGDTIPLRISIAHVKPIRSVNGIVVTLYRQARVDQHPNLPIGPADSKESSRYEDYYPRSRTGLGGLSLSAAGSSQVWRKDLSQTFSPLLVDPRTLTAEVKVGVRVPEDAIPSIRNAPGEMISFTYTVEVVIDIHGKLGSTNSILPTLSMVDAPSQYGSSAAVGDQSQGEILTAWGLNCVDTSQLRREKNAITCVCDLIVGTTDSAKANGQNKTKNPRITSRQIVSGTDEQQQISSHQMSLQESRDWSYRNGQYADWNGNGNYYPGDYDEYYDEYGYGERHDYNHDPYYHEQSYQTTNGHGIIAPPQPDNEEELPEKERLRRAEARLGPSQPPGQGGPSGTVDEQEASAPYLTNGGYHETVLVSAQPAFQASGTPLTRTRADSVEPRVGDTGNSAPSYTAAAGEAANSSRPTDDKQELERGRLEAETSVPPMSGSEPGPSGSSNAEEAAPSAPLITEEDELQTVGPSTSAENNEELTGREQLPQYER